MEKRHIYRDWIKTDEIESEKLIITGNVDLISHKAFYIPAHNYIM